MMASFLLSRRRSLNLLSVALYTVLRQVHAQLDTTQPGVWPINVTTVSIQTRVSWCNSEIDTCNILCLQAPRQNTCDGQTLAFTCHCSNNSSPGLQFYQDTIPSFTCYQAHYDCQDGSTSGIADCADIGSSCGKLNPSLFDSRVVDTSSSDMVFTIPEGTSIPTSTIITDTIGNGLTTTKTGSVQDNLTTRRKTGIQDSSKTTSGAPGVLFTAQNIPTTVSPPSSLSTLPSTTATAISQGNGTGSSGVSQSGGMAAGSGQTGDGGGDEGLSTGAKAGIGVGAATCAILAAGVVACAVFQCRRRRRRRSEIRDWPEVSGRAGASSEAPFGWGSSGSGDGKLKPLGPNEKAELDARRRTAELEGKCVPVEMGLNEREELEVRRLLGRRLHDRKTAVRTIGSGKDACRNGRQSDEGLGAGRRGFEALV
ncbi:hypothetical protein QBC46DRAFT_382910 [Diplogelasinospora grovesii]|uniref:DUF7707 domain-containing protein n=1 Tax=Diplogelasinospora grovesii TaxID=303347 RepID=A0AAN6NA89_9PEZI|nr:hypothetical protein QBC46DRAFT_382910 [Diplogelasinospora grovesii]